jgi:hypothetical protein
LEGVPPGLRLERDPVHCAQLSVHSN